jgi:peptide/nickel transport system permease protein
MPEAGPAQPVAAAAPPQDVRAGRSLWGDARRRIVRDPVAMICLGVIVLYALIAVGAAVYEIVAEHVEGVQTFLEMADPQRRNQPPSLESWQGLLGTDWAGKSVLIKTLLGAKLSMSVGLISNVIAVPIGMLLGALAGLYGRHTDAVIVWLFSTLASIPGIILLIAIKAAFQGVEVLGLDLGGIYGVYIALGVINWIGVCRLVRAETRKLRELDYVLAARAAGRGRFAILLRHVLPNVTHLGIIRFSLGFVAAVQSEVILSYLNLGVKVGTTSWGTMINNAQMDLIVGRWWELTSAVVAMFLLVLALNIFGDRLRDALDPRLRNV